MTETMVPAQQEGEGSGTPAAEDAQESGSPPAEAKPAGAGRRRVIAGLAGAAALPALWYVATRPVVPTVPAAAPPGGGGPPRGVGPLVDHEAPGFSLRDPGGQPVELKQFRGRPVLLNFWATWCAPCKEEMPEFEQVYREYRDRGLVVLAVTIEDERSAQQVPAYVKEGSPKVGSYTFPVALDTKQEAAKAYKLTGIPSSFFIDKVGVIRALYPGAMSRQMILERLKTILPGVS